MACQSRFLLIMFTTNPEFHMLISFPLVLWIFSICCRVSHGFITLLQGITLVILLIHIFFPVTFEGFYLYWKNPLNILKVSNFELRALVN